MGKSNTIKVIADTLITSGKNIGQVIFDQAGQYAYWNDQDKTSLFLLHRTKCTRYSLRPRLVPEEKKQGIDPPVLLKANFYK